jgi:hypothetical protein
MNKITFDELRKQAYENKWKKAVIVFTEDSFNKKYPLESRSYEVYSNAKAFIPNSLGFSMFGNCLDGTDKGVNLVNYMFYHDNPDENWRVEYCYIIE